LGPENAYAMRVLCVSCEFCCEAFVGPIVATKFEAKAFFANVAPHKRPALSRALDCGKDGFGIQPEITILSREVERRWLRATGYTLP
jgi:hypothetical protein